MADTDREYQSILPVVRAYKSNCLENQKILADIKRYRLQYKARLDQLKEEREQLESNILDFMDRFKHPGIRDQDTTILKHDRKPKQSLASKSNQIHEVLNRHHIDSEVQKEVITTLRENKGQGKPTLKIKITKN